MQSGFWNDLPPPLPRPTRRTRRSPQEWTANLMKALADRVRSLKAPGHRRLDLAVLLAGAAAIAGLGAIGARAGNAEQVDGLWVSASLGRYSGSAEITEIIDYDFGAGNERHGIYRDVPGLDRSAPVQVDSPTAPDRTDLLYGPGATTTRGATRIRIGDPNTTIDGRHRYVVRYPLAGVAPGGRVDYNAVGDRWEVDLREIEVHVRAPWTFADVQCHQGSAGDRGGCSADQVQPGHLVVTADRLSSGQGITLQAAAGAPLDTLPAAPVPPREITPDDGIGMARPAAVAGGAMLTAALLVSRLVRRAGREEVWAGATGSTDATDAAFGPTNGASPTVRVDTDELRDLATTEFAPPDGVTAPQGGIILAEQVRDEHAVAWLLEEAASGTVRLEGDERKPTLVKGDGDLHPILAPAFDDGITSVQLGKYDPEFAKAWRKVNKLLERWKNKSGLWTEAGDRARKRARIWGGVAAVVGAAGVYGAAWLSGRLGVGAIALIVGAAVVAGAGVSLAVRSWELRVRNVEGTGLWLRVESFRRFLAASEAQHADWAAEQGILRQYTAWAVAVGEIDRWADAVSSSSVAASTDAAAVHMAGSAPRLSAATQAAAVKPSSGGGGFGGGGGVGGGGGGGGGGSW